MPGERYSHIFLSGYERTQGFTSPRQGGSSPRIPTDRDRAKHSGFLKKRLEEAWTSSDQHQLNVAVHVERHGAYLEFEGAPGFDLMIQSLENLNAGIRLLNVRTEGEGTSKKVLATVYVPHAQRSFFLRKIQAYASEIDGRNNKPKFSKLINSISDIRTATLRSFWRVEEWTLIPKDAPAWVEVWLRSDNDLVISRFEALLKTLRIELADGVLKFPERAVKLLLVNGEQLGSLIELSDDIAEFRIAKEIATFFIEIENQDQIQHVQGLLSRAHFNGNNQNGIVVCLLDKGVNNGHLLLQPVLSNSDLHTVETAWGPHDDPQRPHGTLMAGMAAYGDFLEILNSTEPLEINHRLESVKILPPWPNQNRKELWGHRTIQGVSLSEINAPQRKRIICMAITSEESPERGRPSSWSAAVDEMTSGYEDDIRRFVIISAGNVQSSQSWRNYPQDNLTNEVRDPGQAWNALTVGSYTTKTRIIDPTMLSFEAIAPSGGLSPYSTTSTTWPARKWPIKPEVVFEGGNVARGPNDSILDHDDLQLISTYHDPQSAQFSRFNATSASSAIAAWMAAQIQAEYPNYWPETIRALLVHTAEWTDEMRGQFLPSNPTKQDFGKLLRICGYGVPNLERSKYCASNSLTLISEAELQPFDKNESRYVTRDMHLYNLPWPSDVLAELGEVPVRMRITLSYFIEPGPGEIGWDNRYRYASHALRFAVNGPGESEQEFVRRVNDQARDDGETPSTEGPGDRWLIGDARNVGSIHSDIWDGQAADLAASNKIAIYPAVGWWRERHHLDRWNRKTRYSLIVSIYTPEESANIYIPVAQQVGITVPITVQTRP